MPEPDRLVMVDEEGAETECELAGTVEVAGQQYAVIVPVEYDPEGGIWIQRVDENGIMWDVEDDAELEAVVDRWEALAREQSEGGQG